ncbi:hypothetical protein L596_021133 [Steinernema carpocapsae]|uniref:Uncharacterized protein n=1 Tax=Steinernema carpocapsae TaxID=34508 RepID=A0A4U5MWF2_STECR|nr:hypothetical protein L596_021133 [Steinernema carpocapsae]
MFMRAALVNLYFLLVFCLFYLCYKHYTTPTPPNPLSDLHLKMLQFCKDNAKRNLKKCHFIIAAESS